MGRSRLSMSTTIERMTQVGTSFTFLPRVAGRMAIFAGLFALWIAVMAAVMYVAEVTPAAIAIARSDAIIDHLPQDARLLRTGANSVVVRGETPGYVRRLYSAGAWLVLPSLRNGCLDLR